MPEELPFYFEGFTDPSHTQVPNAVFDVLLPRLSEAELKVLMYICRRTFGFGKKADAVSVTQMEKGITTREGKVLDLGTGLSRTSIRKGAQGLVDKGVLTVQRVKSDDGEYETNIYSLRFRDSRVGQNLTDPRSESDQGVGQDLTPQKKDPQKKVGQDRSKGTEPRRMISQHDRRLIETYLEDYAREFHDQAPLVSTVTRTIRLFADSGRTLDQFLAVLQEARVLTQRASGGIRSEVPDGSGRKSKMAYFLATLEDLISRAA